MVYIPLTLPPTADSEARQIVQNLLDPQLADVHAMLRLPKGWPGLGAGCNLSAALVLFSVVGGVSTALFQQGELSRRGNRGDLFVEVLQRYYPWVEEPSNGTLPPQEAAKRLYKAFRNPLTHSLGIYDGPYIGDIKIAKGPLTENEITNLECASSRPSDWPSPALWTERNKTILIVKCFYWGVRRMIWNVVEARTVITPRFDDVAGQPPVRRTISATATTSPTFGITHVSSGPTFAGDEEDGD